MLLILQYYLFIIWVLWSFGLAVVSLIRRIQEDLSFEPRAFDFQVLLGLTLLTSILSICSLFLAIDEKVLLAVVLFSITSTLLHLGIIRDSAVSFFKNACISKLVYIIPVLLIFILISVLGSSYPIFVQDTGLYHAQSIKWIQEYPVIRGLGNIHSRLAFNSHYFIINALFTFEKPGIYLLYPLNGALLLLFFIRLSMSLRKAIIGTIWGETVLSLMLIFCAFSFLLTQATSPSPDVISAVLICYIFLFLFENRQRKLGWSENTFISVLILLLVVFKLSNLPLVLLIVPLIWRTDIKVGLVIFSMSILLLIVPFLIRNYFLSGYLIYPFPEINLFDPDWKIPVKTVSFDRQEISRWAKIPGGDRSVTLKMSIVQWTQVWWSEKKMVLKLLAGLCLLLPITIVRLSFRNEKRLAFLGFATFFSLFFWFFTAPDPRFAFGSLFVGAGLVLGSIIGYARKPISLIKRNSIVSILLFVYCASIIYFIENTVSQTDDLRKNIVSPHWYPKPLVSKQQLSDFDIFVAQDGLCHNCALPCSPKLPIGVTLRTSKTDSQLKGGFRVMK